MDRPGPSERKEARQDRPSRARAVAQFVRQEVANLSPVAAEDETAVLDLFAVEREAAIGEATRLRNQIHALLMQLDPECQRRLPTLKSAAGLAALANLEAPDDRALSKARVQSVHRLAERLALALRQAEEVSDYICASAAECAAPLTELCGINLLTAGTLAGILGPGRRFASDAALASYAGASQLEAFSAGHTRHRLNRGGNRRVNAVLYRIALTQAHHSPEARAYLARRVSEGKTKREAMRALKRFISRAIWQLWNTCPVATPSRLQAASCT